MKYTNRKNSLAIALKKRWNLVVFCVFISAVAAFIYTQQCPSKYKASATIKIETNPVSDPNGSAAMHNVSANTYAEAELLRSRDFVKRSVARSGLFVACYKNSWSGKEELFNNSPVHIDFSADDSTFYQRNYTLNLLGNNHFELSGKSENGRVSREGDFGKKICDNGVCITITKNKNFNNYKSSSFAFSVFSPEALANHILENRYEAEPVGENVNVVRISYTCDNPEKARYIVNAIADNYINESNEQKKNGTVSTVEFINKQLTMVGGELQKASSSIKDFRSGNGIVNIGQATEATYRTLGELEIQKVDINLQLASLENMSDYLRRSRDQRFTAPAFGALPDDLFKEAVNDLNAKFRERSELTLKYTADDDRVKAVDSDIQQRKAFLVESINNTRRKLLARQDELNREIAVQKSSFRDVPEKETTLQDLTRNYDLYNKVYNYLLEKRTETIITKQVNLPSNSILESAALPLKPVQPDKAMVWTLFLLCGFITGGTFAYMRNRYKPVVGNPDDLSAAATIPVIGQIEHIGLQDSAYEAFSNLCTRIIVNRKESGSQVITITSTHQSEGKSFVSSNLAMTFAAMNKKVLLVDADTHNPSVAAKFNIEALQGIQDAFKGHSTVSELIQHTEDSNLDILPATENGSRIGHLLAGALTKEIISDLRNRYEVIIIDTPEAGVYADAVPFMKWSDINLYIVRAESSGREKVLNAEMVKKEYRLKEVYFVLNAMREKRNHTGRVVLNDQSNMLKKQSLLARLFTF